MTITAGQAITTARVRLADVLGPRNRVEWETICWATRAVPADRLGELVERGITAAATGADVTALRDDVEALRS